MGSRKFTLAIFLAGRGADDRDREQTIGAGTTSEVHSTRLIGGWCMATRKRIFALRPFAPRRLPSSPPRHGMVFRFHCSTNSSTPYAWRARHSVSIARQFSSTRYERHTRHSVSMARQFSSTRYERHTRHSVSIARQFSSTRYERHTRRGYVLHTQRAGHSSLATPKRALAA